MIAVIFSLVGPYRCQGKGLLLVVLLRYSFVFNLLTINVYSLQTSCKLQRAWAPTVYGRWAL